MDCSKAGLAWSDMGQGLLGQGRGRLTEGREDLVAGLREAGLQHEQGTGETGTTLHRARAIQQEDCRTLDFVFRGYRKIWAITQMNYLAHKCEVVHVYTGLEKYIHRETVVWMS